VIYLFTDGAAQGNPGPGGYGAILRYGQHEKELSQGFRLTTNNRMELLAVIVGLEAIRKEGIPVTIYSDSRYVVDAVEKGWLMGWEKKGFAKKANPDLWQRYLPLHSLSPDSSGFAAMPAIRKMNVAINWPWQRPPAAACCAMRATKTVFRN
jgi:ribonuclease HI